MNGELGRAAALAQLHERFAALARVLRETVPALRQLESEAFPELPPELEDLTSPATYPESLRLGLDLIAAERIPALVALLEAVAKASATDPEPDEEEVAKVWRSLDPRAPPTPAQEPWQSPFPRTFGGELDDLLAQVTAEPDPERLNEAINRLEDEQAAVGPRLPRPRRFDEDELVTSARQTLRKLLRHFPKPRSVSSEEIEAWLARPFGDRWAEIMTAEPSSDLARVRRLLEVGAEFPRSHQERRQIALWALAVVAARTDRPEPKVLWIDLQARAWAILGLAALETGDIQHAEFAIEEAWNQLERGSGDPLLLIEIGVPSFLLDWRRKKPRHLSPVELRFFARAWDPRVEGELCLWQALDEETRGIQDRAAHSRRIAAALLGERHAAAKEASFGHLLRRLGLAAGPEAGPSAPVASPSRFDVH